MKSNMSDGDNAVAEPNNEGDGSRVTIIIIIKTVATEVVMLRQHQL
jgi:hypothetical protein